MNELTRRRALATVTGALAALGITPVAAATAAGAPPPPEPVPAQSEETYQGRLIRITEGGTSHHGGAAAPVVRIDGDELHIMRNADGTWISVVNHYETHPDPLSLARAAVRELRGSALAPFAAAGGAA